MLNSLLDGVLNSVLGSLLDSLLGGLLGGLLDSLLNSVLNNVEDYHNCNQPTCFIIPVEIRSKTVKCKIGHTHLELFLHVHCYGY